MLLLLGCVGLLLAGLAWRASTNDHDHRVRSLARSTEATAREIELHLAGLRRALNVFAIEQRELLQSAVVPAFGRIAAESVASKVALHFPEHLAFAVSDPTASSPLVSELDLFGAHCRAGLEAHARHGTSIQALPSLHRAGPGDVGHFDVMSDIPGPSPTSLPVGVMFVSFRIDDLQRLLRLGSPESGTLILRAAPSDAESGSSGTLVRLSGDAYEDGLTAVSGSGAFDGTGVEVAIPGTFWTLTGRIDPATSADTRNALALQALLGLGALMLAGVVAWRAVEQERSGHDRASLLLTGVEVERRRIATELHDQVLADVSHTRRLLLDFEANMEDAGPIGVEMTHLHEARRSVQAFSGAVRTVIDDLYPHTLENLALCGAIEAHVQSRTVAGVAFELDLDEAAESLLDAGRSLYMFRIVVEVVENLLRRAKASRAVVGLRQDTDRVRLRVEDDGTGFDPRRRRRDRGRGVNNIEMRASALDAQVRWTRPREGGTRFDLVVPVHGVP